MVHATRAHEGMRTQDNMELTEDFDRRRKVEVPDGVPFVTKSQLAQCMLAWSQWLR